MKTLGRALGVLVLLAGIVLACRHGDPTAPAQPEMPPWFADVSSEVGLDFIHDPGPLPGDRYFMPQALGSGAALFDYDNDGRLDIYLVQNGGPGSKSRNRLFHQEPDGHFKDVSQGSGLDVTGYGMGVAVGDVDNDGYPDVLLTEYGRIRLFHNNGNGTFTDVTKQAGLDNPQWATAACFLDYDRDGWLDLAVVNYVEYDPTKVCVFSGSRPDYCGPKHFPGAVTRLFHNRGRKGKAGPVTFEDVTLTAGLATAPGPGLGVLAADLDGDGWPDLFVTNDSQPNRAWINRHDGTFRDEAAQRGLAYDSMGNLQGNMGIAFGDVDGSGRLSVYVTHLTEEANILWKQEARGQYRDVTAEAGLAAARWRGTGFGAVLGDFDNDGALDLAVVNGRVARAKVASNAPLAEGLDPFWAPYAERNQLFAGAGTGHFRDVSPAQPSFCGRAGVSRGLAVGDLNNDGGLDLLMTTVGGPVRLYRNVAPHRGHWLLVWAVDPALKRAAYGTEVVVEAGGRHWHGWINPGSSYLCSNDPRAHFGLGGADRIEGITVRWPDGSAERFPGRPADQVVVLKKGEGTSSK